MEFTVAQLCLLRCLLKDGISCDLMEIILNRCGANGDDLNLLKKAKHVRKSIRQSSSRFVLTKEGRREYAKQKHGRYF